MNKLNRRSFFCISAAGLSAFHGPSVAFAALPSLARINPYRAAISFSNVHNLKLFLQDKTALDLTGLVSMRPVIGKLGSYPTATLFLFPVARAVSSQNLLVFLPGSDASRPLIPAAPLVAAGLPPDEYFCNYVLEAPPQSFVSFSISAAFDRGAARQPWHSNVDLAGATVGIGWASSNLNHPWFDGSRWIPDRGDGKMMRERIIDGLRQAAAPSAGLGEGEG